MTRATLALGVLIAGGARATPSAPAPSGAPPVSSSAPAVIQFNRDIRPLLSDACFACHGFDAKHRKAGLRLDLPEGATALLKSGRSGVVPGQPEQSEVWRRLTTDDPDDQMPPAETHRTFTPAQKDLIRRWIEQGAPYQQHWAFEPPVAVPPPRVGSPTPPHPVDRFLVARLDDEGLRFTPEAPREQLVRRLSFDLTGLPPTPEEVDAFVWDTAPGAYERLVDRLLASPRYGEQMARHWLDVARYADTHGLHLDNERSIWPYRDWVVRAFNRNLSFDEFTVEQLAGDLLPSPTQDQLVATGFSRNNVTTSEGGSIDAEFVFRYAVDRASTMAQTWMGLTAGCAVCHDHKFDPISAREFYSMYAFFLNAADPPMDGNIQLTPPILRLSSPADQDRLTSLDRRIAQTQEAIEQAFAAVDYTDPATLTPPPPPREVEEIWADESLPTGWTISASPGSPTQFVTNGPPGAASGRIALRRQDQGLAQDVIETGSTAPLLPAGARLFAHVWIDPAQPPKAIMIQYRSGDWRHRAVWGDYDAIDWGARGTTERVHLGSLPRTGAWVRLELEAARVGLEPGTRIAGFALTQFGGTVWWDKVGVLGRSEPATDPSRSLMAWTRQWETRDAGSLPEDLRAILKGTPPEKRTDAQNARVRRHYLVNVCADTRSVFDPLLEVQAGARKARADFEAAIPATLVWRDLENPREAHVMDRGAYDRPGERVTAGVPAILPPLPNTNQPTRLDLARWLVSDRHPLTARVAVNRFWQQFFGTGLVKTSGDFGSQGEPPSHPELLDWLALHFRDSGWNVKGLVRLLVTSEAYRQSSQVTPELLQKDPENRLLARGPRFRLDAEQIRDNALFVSGLLVGDMGGKGVKPYQPPNIWEPVGFVGSNTREYRQDTGAALYRRSLYTFFKRTAPPPFMATFDAPNREQSCTRRERSNTPLQALQLLNDVQHFEAARALAERILSHGGSTVGDRLRYAYRVVLGRPPDPEEKATVESALRRHLARYQNDLAAARQVVAVGESRPDPRLPEAELAAYTLTANLLLNLDETITRP